MTASLQSRRGPLAAVAILLMMVAALLVASPASAAPSPTDERPAVFRDGTWYLRPALSTGPSTSFGFGLAGDRPVMGDWNRDGLDTVGVFRNGVWYMRNANSSGPSFSFGFGLAGDLPVAGDWDGDGIDTPGVFRNGVWYMRNANSTGPSFSFGSGWLATCRWSATGMATASTRPAWSGGPTGTSATPTAPGPPALTALACRATCR
jgi:hypothetical protein